VFETPGIEGSCVTFVPNTYRTGFALTSERMKNADSRNKSWEEARDYNVALYLR
jgi:hypothetical protein